MSADEPEMPGRMGVSELGQEQPLEQPRENPHGQEEAGPARHPPLTIK